MKPVGTPGLTDEDAVPEFAEVAIIRLGDIWLLGEHRLAWGDCTDAEAVAALLGDVKPLLMVTDPPHGVEYDPEWRHRQGVNESKRRGKVRNDARADWGDARALVPRSIVYVWHGALHATLYVDVAVRRWQPSPGRARRWRQPGRLSTRSLLHELAKPRRLKMHGRKPKLTKLMVLTGNPGKRTHHHNEPRPEPAVPDYPPELSKVAQREWQRLVGELSKLILLTHLDRAALAV